jgi:hypothetical protein
MSSILGIPDNAFRILICSYIGHSRFLDTDKINFRYQVVKTREEERHTTLEKLTYTTLQKLTFGAYISTTG